MVEVKRSDLYCNARDNLCYGQFLKTDPLVETTPMKILAAKCSSITKKVNYKQLVEDLWKTHISDDPEEDQVLKKTMDAQEQAL